MIISYVANKINLVNAGQLDDRQFYDFTREEIYDLKVECGFSNNKEDASGSSCDTATVSQGFKAANISCSMNVKSEGLKYLNDLRDLAQMTDEDYLPVEFEITDELCNALNIRHVIFNGEIRIKKIDGIQAYSCSFALQEVSSIAQKKETKEKQLPVNIFDQ